MKKTASILLTMLMLFALVLPCAAASPANFSMKIVSESDSEFVISLDYDGGSSFQNFDFELKYNEKKLKPKEAYDGDGSFAFQTYSKKNGNPSISVVNKDINPIKCAFASTVPFKAVQGKDMFIFSFQKLSKDKIAKSDISFKFTTCQLNDANVQVNLSTPWSAGSDSGNAQSQQNAAQTSVSKPTADTSKATGVTSESTELVTVTDNQSSDVSSAEDTETNAMGETEVEKDGNSTKKIIIVVAAALCMVMIIVGVIISIRKKSIEE